MFGRAWLALGLVAGIGASVDTFLPHEAASSGPAVARLVDLYRPEAVEGRVPPPGGGPRVEWRFDGDSASRWQTGAGVRDLAVENGRLSGGATSTVPILSLELPALPETDVVHEVQVRMRVSEGTEVAATLRGPAPIDFPFEAELLRVMPWPLTSPAIAGDEMQTYTLRASASVITRGRRHLLLRPTDRQGATFEIESVRLVTRREHLGAVASGVGWQGLSEIYRESLVARAPEAMRFRLRLPRRSRLDLAVGTIEDWPVRFRVTVRGSGEEETLAERTVTAANRWEPLAVDLERFGGRTVTLSLALAAERPGTLGLWGSPVVRDTAAADSPGTRQAARGVVLIWADTLRRDHLDAYGYSRPTAPNVREMAEQGVRFTDCQAQASWTKVSGPSILTSLYPTTHGVANIPDRLPASATTIAEAFREAGFATLGLSSIGFVGRMTNLHQGFEEFHESTSLPAREGSFKSSPVLVDRLLPWLEAHRDVPFFALLHVADPHSPFRPPPPYDTLWADPARREEYERQEKAVRPLIANPNMRRFGMPTRDEMLKAGIDPEPYVAFEKDWYDGSIRGMDAEIGRLRERIAEMGMEDRIVVAFISDHGESFLEHGQHFHGNSIYGELTNVPLIFWGPAAVASGRVVDGPVQLIDVMPTLLDLAGVRPPAGMQGRSLAAALRAGPGPYRLEPRPAVSEKQARAGAVGAEQIGSLALVSGRWKLIHNHERPAGVPEFELYDHAADPLDLTDVAARHPDVVARLARELAAWRSLAQGARLKPDTDAGATLGKEELEKLRALGYIQ